MKREFLQELGLSPEVVDAILTEVDSETETLRGELASENETLRTEVHRLSYADAARRAISSADGGTGVKFSSKAAERAFVAALTEACPELKDGSIEGFDEFLAAERLADPGAFAAAKPTVRLVGRIGGGIPEKGESRAARAAAKFRQDLYGGKE